MIWSPVLFRCRVYLQNNSTRAVHDFGFNKGLFHRVGFTEANQHFLGGKLIFIVTIECHSKQIKNSVILSAHGSGFRLYFSLQICFRSRCSSTMSSGGRGQCAASTGSEDEGRGVELGKRKRKPRTKRHIQEKRFVIHPDNLCGTTRSELYQAQTNINDCTTIPIDDRKSEREIRDILVAKLPKLEGKR